MTPHARFEIAHDTSYSLVIRDTGHQHGRSITNDAEYIVDQLAQRLGNRRLYYYDSAGRLDQLLVKNGKFAGFAAANEQQLRNAEQLGDAFALGYSDAHQGITPLTPLPNEIGERDAYSLGFQLGRQHMREPPQG